MCVRSAQWCFISDTSNKQRIFWNETLCLLMLIWSQEKNLWWFRLQKDKFLMKENFGQWWCKVTSNEFSVMDSISPHCDTKSLNSNSQHQFLTNAQVFFRCDAGICGRLMALCQMSRGVAWFPSLKAILTATTLQHHFAARGMCKWTEMVWRMTQMWTKSSWLDFLCLSLGFCPLH